MRQYGPAVLRVVVSFGLILLLLRQVPAAEVTALLRAGLDRWPLLLAAALLPGLGLVIAALRWRALLGGLGVRPPLRILTAAMAVGAFFNTFLPSTIGGDVARGWWLRGALGGSAVRSLTVVALDRLIGLFALCAVGLIAAALVASAMGHAAPGLGTVVAGAGVTLGLAALAALLFHPVAPRLARLLFALPPLRRLRDRAVPAGEALAGLRRARARLAASFGLGLVLQLNVVAEFLVLAAAFEVEISLWALAVLVPIVNLVTLLPVSINGLGVRETALAALGAPLGLGLGEAVLLAYGWVLFALAWGLVGGGVYFCGRSAAAPPAAASTAGLLS